MSHGPGAEGEETGISVRLCGGQLRKLSELSAYLEASEAEEKTGVSAQPLGHVICLHLQTHYLDLGKGGYRTDGIS